MSAAGHKGKRGRSWQTWAFAAVPVAGLIELGAQFVQTHSVVPERDWLAARDYVAAQARSEDLVVFAPRWADPIGRQLFGSSIATLAREGRPDESRFPRALEVAIRGGHLPALAGWHRVDAARFGGVIVTTWENPSPTHVLDDLVTRADPVHLHVFRMDGERAEDCPWSHGGPQSGQLGFGTAMPADRFACASGGFVATSVVEDAEYDARRCISAPPLGGRTILRLRFSDVQIGHVLHGHHALYVEADHAMKAPVVITFTVSGVVIGKAIHRDFEGWKPFEFDTSALFGERTDVLADIECPTAERRMYCFEADTR